MTVYRANSPLQDLCKQLRPFVEFGVRPSGMNREMFEATMQVGLKIITANLHDSLGNLTNQYLEACSLLSDAFDKLGKYRQAREAVEVWGFVSKDLSNHAVGATKLDADRLNRICWVGWAMSVSHHRYAETDSAIGITKRILQIDAEPGNSLEPGLRAKVSYAHARHLQKPGQLHDADLYFTKALSIANEMVCSATTRAAMAQPRHLSGIFMIQIARLSLETGYLDRAWRQLQIAEILIHDPEEGGTEVIQRDSINWNFIQLLKGCIRRQQSDLDGAIVILKAVKKAFEAEKHWRYLFRALHELAKAHYNLASTVLGDEVRRSEEFKEASKNLKLLEDQLRENDDFIGDRRTKERWNVNRYILEARILREQNALPQALRAIELARDILSKPPLERDSQDLRTLAAAVHGEILLDKKDFAQVIHVCQPIETRLTGKPEEAIDHTDQTWLRVVLWQAYQADLQVDSAKAMQKKVGELDRIENHYVRARALAVKELQDTLEEGFVISSATANFDYKHWETQLKKWLVETVQAKFPKETDAQQAERMKVSRQTVTAWRTQIKDVKREKTL